MNIFNKKFWTGKDSLLIWLLAIFLVLPGCGKKENEADSVPDTRQAAPVDPVLKKVILSVNQRDITNLDFKNYFDFTYQRIKVRNLNENLLKVFYDKFVDRMLILTRIQKDNFTVSDEEFRSYLSNFRVLDNTNPTILKNDYVIQKYLSEVVYNGINISEQQILNYYSSHRKDYKRKEQILLWQIKTATSRDALRIREELIKDKTRFEEIARRESDSIDKKNGGRMGYFEKGVLPVVIEKYVFALKVNNISAIVDSDWGFHIFKVTEKKRAQTLPMYAVKDQIVEKLTEEEADKRKENLLNTLRVDYSVTRYYENLYILDKIKKTPEENQKNESN